MERIQTLVDKLYQQKQHNASPAHLLLTVQMLQAELLKLQQKNGSFGTSKVAVTLPVNFNFVDEVVNNAIIEADKEELVEKKVKVAPVPVAEVKPEPVVEVKEEPAPVRQPILQFEDVKPVEQKEQYFLRKPVPAEPEVKAAPREELKHVFEQKQVLNPAFDFETEVPTFNQYQIKETTPVAPAKEVFELKPAKEIHELIGEQKESLNDRLKDEKTEVAHVLKGSPVKDLRKAVGINDRFVFINELFRGDEAMYDRSIKTINGFTIFPEAEYWMARELKLKLGWDDRNDIVQHFYEIVRRRFS